MSSDYRTGTLHLVPSEKNSDYLTISNNWKNTLNKYKNDSKKFNLNFSILSTDPYISNLFFKFLLSKSFNICLELEKEKKYKFNYFQFSNQNKEYNQNEQYNIYEFHILLLKIYYFKYCFFQIIPEDLRTEIKEKIKSGDDPIRELEVYKYSEEDAEEIEKVLLDNSINLLNDYLDIIFNIYIEEPKYGGIKKKSNIYTGTGSNGDQKNTLNTKVDIYKLVDFIVNNSSLDSELDDSDYKNYSKIIDTCICRELFTCRVTTTGGNKIHKSLKELKTYAKKINITCSNKNKSELCKAIKQINLNNLKIDELKEYCKFFNIKGYSKYKNKKSLIKFINEHNI